MSNKIHETAIVHDGAKLGDNNFIGAYCIIYPDVVIGNNNVFFSHCSIGSEPEHKTSLPNKAVLTGELKFKKVVIGDNNRFNEFVTVGRGSERDTVVGDNCFVMNGSYISHDTILRNNVTLSSNSLIGGYSTIDDYANFGLGAICHQYSHIGTGAMLGMGAIVPKNKKVIPFNIYVGNPIKILKENKHLIGKLGFNENEIKAYRSDYSSMWRMSHGIKNNKPENSVPESVFVGEEHF
jgi:UDP-N-acetylglucosamine acyltransferase